MNNVRILREEQLLTKAELARKAGISPLTLARIEGGSGADASARGELAAARDAMMALHRVYVAQVNRFAKEEGDLAQAAAEALAHARESVGRGR